MPTETTNLDYYGKRRTKTHVGLLAIDGGKYGTGDHRGLVQQVVAGRNPTVVDDDENTGGIGKSILKGCQWLNESTGTIYNCTNNATGASVWVPSGGGGGALSFYGQGILAGQITEIDFIGVGVSTSFNGTKGNVYIPPASFAPWYNTGSCAINSIPTFNRHVSNPTIAGTPFDIGAWIAGSIQPCHQSVANTIYDTPLECSFENDTNTTFEVTIYGADGVTPIATFETPIINGNGVHSGSNITITISNWAVENSKFKANIDTTIAIGTILPNGGRYSVELTHHNDGIDYTKTQGAMFMDQEDTVASLTGVTIIETVGNVITRHISGVEYYTINSQFTLDIADIDNLNDSSYPTTQVTAIGSDYGLPTLPLVGGDLAGWTVDWDDVNDTYNKTDWAVNAVQFCSVDVGAIVSARTQDWVNNPYVNSVPDAICVNTYTNNSTRIYEDFRLETNRLLSDFATSWDETQDLLTYDGGQGLQFQCSRLIYPQFDFSTYDPNPVTQPDYTTASGARPFNRRWWHDGVSHSNGIFQFGDYNITEADITSKAVLIEISLDGIAWFVVNDNYLGGALVDGAGCRVNPGVNSLSVNNRIEFSLGTGGFTSVGSGGGWGIFMRLTFDGSDITDYIGVLQITNWS